MGRMDLAIESAARRRQPHDHLINIIEEFGSAHRTKDYDLHVAARTGDLDHFERVLDQVSEAENVAFDDIMCRLSPTGNTYMHLAAKHGHDSIVTTIAAKKPSLVLCKNFDGETALHLAAEAGNESTVRALVKIHQDMVVVEPSTENAKDVLLRAENERGNTALHEALINGWVSIAEYLIEQEPEVSFYMNKDGESALYLAAKAGFAECVSLILRLPTDEELVKDLFKKKSPIQAAIQGKHTGVLSAMFKMNPSLIHSRDDQGRNPLHYAASLGFVSITMYLLREYARNATLRDETGSLPIHLALIEGHVSVLWILFQNFPDLSELLDADGCHILHLAVKNGRYDIVRFVLKKNDFSSLINMKDKQGNTPLHLATKHWHPKIAHALTWDKRVDINIVNNEGMTALDVVESNMSDNPPFAERLTWAALKSAGTPRSPSGNTASRKKSSNKDNYKERVNTLLLVSTLVVMVTFTAGFTMPGGYNSSDSGKERGMATMIRYKAFHVFVFCDTIALYTSIVVATALIWAQLGDLTFTLYALTLAVPLLGIALCMMSVAFTAGVFLVTSNLRRLATTILLMGITFITILIPLFLPLCVSLTSRNRVLRYLSYYPLHWMIQATTS